MVALPKKSQFKLNEIVTLTGVKPYVLRFWEGQFKEITPAVSSSGQRIYSRESVQAILKIKDLLYQKKLSIDEAKLALVSPDKPLPESKSLKKAPSKSPVVKPPVNKEVESAEEVVKTESKKEESSSRIEPQIADKSELKDLLLTIVEDIRITHKEVDSF